ADQFCSRIQFEAREDRVAGLNEAWRWRRAAFKVVSAEQAGWKASRGQDCPLRNAAELRPNRSARLCRGLGLARPGVETRLDAAGRSACATKLFAAGEGFRVVQNGLLFFGFFALLLALLHGFQALFAALGAFGGALDQLAADQFHHGLLGSVAPAPAQ